MPMRFRRNETVERHCGELCPLGAVERSTIYARDLFRLDDRKADGSSYKSYYLNYRSLNGGNGHFATKSYGTLRGALIEMCEILEAAGIIPCGQDEV